MAKKKKISNRLQAIGDSQPRSSMPPMPGRESETQLVELGMFVSATVVGTLILAGFAVIFGLQAIENHLETQATSLIDQAVATVAEEDPTISLRSDVAVEASAIDLHLRGTVGFEDHLFALETLVKQIEGVGEVSTELEYLPAVKVDVPDITASPITITWENGSATIVGEVSDEANRAALIENLEEHFSRGVTADEFTVKEGAPSERDWLSAIIGLIDVGAEGLPEGRLFINAAERLVKMSGEYETRQDRANAQDDIDELIAATTFSFSSGLSIPEPPPFTREDVEEIQKSIDELVEGKVVEFELNSDVLTSVGIALLDEIVAALEEVPDVPIEISGHTDSQGDAEENMDLSERRAQAALDYFVANGQDPARFVVKGYGEDVPVASNDTADGRARNRRIEFKALEE
ncbi:MAG: OmpA family protein [Acidimicrobiia bacterium]|nr:OmpA family protein [Acidimicrobiia bacterium]